MKTLSLPLKVAILLNAIIQFAICAPRRSPSYTEFDQKQTGEYNIQLHLKDFQIIAMVGDDSFGTLGDYDYNYDYSDFTIKPSTPTTTTKKTTPVSSSEETPEGPSFNFNISTTMKPGIAQVELFPIIASSTNNPVPGTKPSATTVASQGSTSNSDIVPQINLIKSKPSENASTVKITANNASLISTTSLPSTTSPNSFGSALISAISSKFASGPTTRTPTKIPPSLLSPRTPLATATSNVPGQIPVFVQVQRNEKPIVKDSQTYAKRTEANHSVTILPLGDSSDNQNPVVALQADNGETPALGEILHYRKCAQGFQRDKRGRCRKVRRPQLPLGITRFASNIAARLRQPGQTATNGDENKDIFE